MTSRRTSAALLGASDGSFTGLGLVLSLVTGLSVSGMVHAALTTAVAGTASMALGELLSDNESGWRDAAAMGVAWASMCLLPVATAYAGLGWWLIPLEFVALGVGMVWARGDRSVAGWLKVFAILVGVAVPTVAVAVVL